METSLPLHLQRGFSLIEALVALLVLSVGLLGLAALQLSALKGAHSAYQRTLASIAARDAEERLWMAAAAGPLQAGAVGSAWRRQWSADADAPDLAALPGAGDSRITCSTGQCAITVAWSEGRFREPEEGTTFDYVVDLPPEVMK
ncbi:type IV pilus modification protein PilV [Ectothiorhodospira mobilis]|uniref:type IV pilus modification protein PilV n=1 Tax=Ectothiorhodospira mobilis TaxID=195064 RepID=UPI001905C39C|nr:type IV pilus modification protein PilV [Ectothiorhodospira mobilis]MBK1691992.1 type IV pilus modification protein PilV [Ectothiorhodospira mobilis]